MVIPNYNGRDLLRKVLPTVLGQGRMVAEVIVVDDASVDSSACMVRQEFPSVRVLTRKSNGGFGVAANDGIIASQTDFVVMLNSDVEVTQGFLQPILPIFDDPTVFAACPKILTTSMGGIDDGAKTGRWHHGMFYTGQENHVARIKPVLFTSGCASVYRRTMLDELDGFDEAYAPYYWEDVDLGYRAWKRGWKSLYQPGSTVLHNHSSTISKLNRSMVDRIKTRNGLFFVWRNIEDQRLWNRHCFWLPLVLARRVARADKAYLKGYIEATARKSEALSAKEFDSSNRVLSDREIFGILGIDT